MEISPSGKKKNNTP